MKVERVLSGEQSGIVFKKDIVNPQRDPVYSEVNVKARFEQTERVFLVFAENNDTKFGVVRLNLKSVARDYSNFRDVIRDIEECIKKHPHFNLRMWHGNQPQIEPNDLYLIREEAIYEPTQSPRCRIRSHASCKMDGCTCMCHETRRTMTPSQKEERIKKVISAYQSSLYSGKSKKQQEKEFSKKVERYEAYLIYCKNKGYEAKSFEKFENE